MSVAAAGGAGGGGSGSKAGGAGSGTTGGAGLNVASGGTVPSERASDHTISAQATMTSPQNLPTRPIDIPPDVGASAGASANLDPDRRGSVTEAEPTGASARARTVSSTT